MMNHSYYPLNYFPDGSFAKRYKDNAPLPQLFLNTLGSGGLYSTPTDMAKIAMMLIGRGKLGNVRILSEDAVREMGIDQTLTSFNPAPANGSRYGLGWDTVRQPGLGAVNVIGWQKGGDVPQYGAVITIAPEEGLAVVVLGASGDFHSNNATVIAERILLRALAEKGRIAATPLPLSLSPRPLKTPTSGQLDSVSGYYATNSALIRVQKSSVNALNITKYYAGTNKWTDLITGLEVMTEFKLRDDDRFAGDADASKSVSFTIADGRQYLIMRSAKGYGHYQDDLIYGQQVAAAGSLPASWSGRLGKKWLVTNEHPDFSDKWESPVMQLNAYDNLLFANEEDFDHGFGHIGGTTVIANAARIGEIGIGKPPDIADVKIEIEGNRCILGAQHGFQGLRFEHNPSTFCYTSGVNHFDIFCHIRNTGKHASRRRGIYVTVESFLSREIRFGLADCHGMIVTVKR
ncbi:MAG: serine hydrolase domain-containing protein [Pseudomonadota bacterium]